MKRQYDIVARIRKAIEQRRGEAELFRMSDLELQDIGYPCRLDTLHISDASLVNFEALSKAKLGTADRQAAGSKASVPVSDVPGLLFSTRWYWPFG